LIVPADLSPDPPKKRRFIYYNFNWVIQVYLVSSASEVVGWGNKSPSHWMWWWFQG
jgi:hypothetical protein